MNYGVTRCMVAALLVAAGCGDDSSVADGGDEETGSDTSGADTGPGTTTTGGATGGATGGSSGDTGAIDPACPVSEPARGVWGRIYVDENQSDQSTLVGGFEDGTDTPLQGRGIRVVSPGGDTRSMNSCPDGRYAFDELEDGVHLVASDEHDISCTQRNCMRRLPVAIEEGAATIVTVGDSVPVLGDPNPFPGRVAAVLGALATVDNRNEAVSGSTSEQWRPGASLFESNLRPNVADADVVVISVGGNDFLNLASMADLTNIAQVLADAEALVEDVVLNVRDMNDEIRSVNPDVDVVFCIYPDYQLASQTPPWDLTSLLPAGTIANLLVQARDLIPQDEQIVVVDLLSASGVLPQPLDDYLDDPLHFNDLGHDFYAEQILATFGTVIIGPSPLSNGNSPLGSVHDYAYGP